MNMVEFLSTHTYRMVFFGTMTIGLVSGALGSFAYLRKQSLVSDVISHSALPGALCAFLVAVLIGADGRNMVTLIFGAAITGTCAVLLANGISRRSKIRIDTAMAICLTLFFGAGMLLLRVITNGAFPGKGGIQDYLFGNASVMTIADLSASVFVGAAALFVMILLWKEFALHTFDSDHSAVLGFQPRIIDAAMFSTLAISIVIGAKAVGLVLMVAFVVTPAAAARQWTHSLPGMVALSAAIGGVASGIGTYLSIAMGTIPTGPLIVLTLSAVFLFSLLASPRRSIIMRYLRRHKARKELLRNLSAKGVGA
ncbi:MAG: metal ABC transporter permease [Actinomycetaceae bacterium]|nr:metal ABC transporter permease [Actinomycetaceae bacterium]